jgi:hypothetical protein
MFLNCQHQFVMWDIIKEPFDVQINYPVVFPRVFHERVPMPGGHFFLFYLTAIGIWTEYFLQQGFNKIPGFDKAPNVKPMQARLYQGLSVVNILTINQEIIH